MPPDFGSPVAVNIDTSPNKGIKTLSDLMSLKQLGQTIQSGALTIQQQQQNLQKGAAETQSTEQSAAQRKGIAGIDWSKYDDGTGTVSTDRMLADDGLRTTAGDQFLDVLKQGAAIRGQQVQNKQAIAGLNDTLRNQFGSLVGALRTDPDVIADNPTGRQKVADSIRQFGEVGGPDAQRVAGIYGQVVNHAPQGQLARGINAIQLQAMDASAQAGRQAPGYASTGAKLTNTNPQAAGGNLQGSPDIKTEVPPGATMFADPTGAQWQINPQNPGQAVRVGQGGQEKPLVLSPGDAQAIPVLEEERNQARNYITSAPIAHATNEGVLHEIDKVSTGTIGPKLQGIFSSLGIASDSAEARASAYDLVGKYLERNALEAAKAMGPHTNAGLESALKANGSVSYNPTAIKKLTKLNDAIVTGAEAYQPGLEKAVSANPQRGVLAKREFDQAWAQNFDPRIMMYERAIRTGDKETKSEIERQMGANGMKELRRKAMNIDTLSAQGRL